MQQPSDVIAYAVVLCLPLLAWVISRPPVWTPLRARVDPYALRLWDQLVEREEPDERVLRRWAFIRLEQLRNDLERVRLRVADDEWMTATRQTGNRLAHERLIHDVRAAEIVAAAYGPVEQPVVVAAPTPRALPRLTLSAPMARSTIEVMEFGPPRRGA